MNNKLRFIAKSLSLNCIALTCFILTGCFDLAGSQSIIKNKNAPGVAKGQVYTMRGGLGGIFSKGMNQMQHTLESDYKIKTESTVWYKANQVSKEIIKQYQTGAIQGPIILAGHSLGANEQIKVARNLEKAHIPVALLITVDAVSPLTVSSNVKHVINIYKPSFVPMFSGLKIKAVDSSKTRIDNLNVNDIKDVKVNHFTIEKNDDIQKIMIDNILLAMNVTHKK